VTLSHRVFVITCSEVSAPFAGYPRGTRFSGRIVFELLKKITLAGRREAPVERELQLLEAVSNARRTAMMHVSRGVRRLRARWRLHRMEWNAMHAPLRPPPGYEEHTVHRADPTGQGSLHHQGRTHRGLRIRVADAGAPCASWLHRVISETTRWRRRRGARKASAAWRAQLTTWRAWH
jgi:hypothetical protein